jgi:hypothetical protein
LFATVRLAFESNAAQKERDFKGGYKPCHSGLLMN